MRRLALKREEIVTDGAQPFPHHRGSRAQSSPGGKIPGPVRDGMDFTDHHGQGRIRDEHVRLGGHDRLDSLQAAMLLAQFDIFHQEVAPRKEEVLVDLCCRRGDFPEAESMSQRIFSLPLHPYLEQAHQERIIAAVLG